MIKQRIQESIAVKSAILEDDALLARIEAVAALIVTTYQQGGKVLFCGNGGSAAAGAKHRLAAPQRAPQRWFDHWNR